MLAEWIQHVDELRNQYHWLLFFSVPKMLHLYHLLQEKNPNVEAIVREISFLCRNDPAARKNAQVVVKVSSGWNKTETRGVGVASFPGLPRLRFLIACSMQKRSQKAW